MLLTDLIANRDYEAFSAYLRERFEIEVPGHHVTEVLLYAGAHRDDPREAPESVDCRMRNRLYELGLLEPMFPEAKDDDHKVTWNELHIFVDHPTVPGYDMSLDTSGYLNPLPEQIVGRDLDLRNEGRYTRSRLSRTTQIIKPVNRNAQNVAPEPTVLQWEDIRDEVMQKEEQQTHQTRHE